MSRHRVEGQEGEEEEDSLRCSVLAEGPNVSEFVEPTLKTGKKRKLIFPHLVGKS